jgi:hypothetical protein
LTTPATGPTADRRFPWRWLIGAALLAAACVLAWPIHRLIELPFSNPWHVSGTEFVEHRYAPGNNIARFIFLVAAPSVLAIPLAIWGALPLPGLRAASKHPRRWRWHEIMLAVVVGVVVVLVAVGMSRPESTAFPVDTFHEGEALGPATDLLHGKIPYRDTLFAHGLGEDPGRAMLAFSLFGRSIASVRVLDAAMQAAAFCLLCLFVALVFVRSPAIGAVAICWLMFLGGLSVFGLTTRFSLGRDVPTNLWLFTCLPLLHPDWTARWRIPAAIANSCLAVATLVYSIDRGMFLAATALATTVVLFATGAGRRVWIANLCGYGLGAAIVAAVLRQGLPDFVVYTFVTMPRYKELYDGAVFQFDRYPAWVPIALIAACTLWLTLRLVAATREKGSPRRGLQDLMREQGLEMVLLVLAVAFFRSALGRASAAHTARASSAAWLCTVVLAGRQIWPRILRTDHVRSALGTFCAWAMIALFTPCYLGFRGVPTMERWRTSTPDSVVVRPSYLDVAAFLRENLSGDESFYTLTGEAIWFYLVDRPCPTRFPVAWFAATDFYQREIARDLAQRNVKYLVYSNDHVLQEIVGADDRRQPILMQTVRRLFVRDRTIGPHEIYRRRSPSELDAS